MRAEQTFTLTIDLERPRLVLSRRGATNGKAQRLLTSDGPPAQRLVLAALSLIHRDGRSIARLEEQGRGRYRLREAPGARLALLLWALAPIQKPSRAAVVRDAITAASDEEVYYWFSRVISRRGQALRALRILLAGE
jgi:hypothetical protein